jgi:hypothetical protein
MGQSNREKLSIFGPYKSPSSANQTLFDKICKTTMNKTSNVKSDNIAFSGNYFKSDKKNN